MTDAARSDVDVFEGRREEKAAYDIDSQEALSLYAI